MRQRYMPFFLLAGLLFVTAIGFVFITSSNEAPETTSQQTVIAVASDIAATDTEAKNTGANQVGANNNKDAPTSEAQDAEVMIPAPVLKTDNDIHASGETAQAESDANPDLSLASEESEAEPTFAITVARVNPDGTSLFAGVAEADATIQLQDGRTLLDETSSDSNGEWVSVPATKLSAGPHLISLTMRTKDGRIATANMSLVVEIAETKTEKPLVALVPQDDTTAPVLLQSPDPDATIEVIEEDVTEIAVPATVPAITIQSLSLTSQDKLLVRGQYSAGQYVSGTFQAKPMLNPEMSNDNRWSGLIDVSSLTDTPQMLEVMLHDASDSVVARTSLALDKNNINQGLTENEMVVVQKGDALWRIAYRTYGKGVRYVEIVRRNQDQISDPDMIFPNQIFVLPE